MPERLAVEPEGLAVEPGWRTGAPGRLAVEPAALATGLATALRTAGLPVAPDRVVRCARALVLLTPTARDRLYWTARVTLVAGPEHLAVFDRVFAAVVDRALDPADARGDPTAPRAVGAARPRPPAVDGPGAPLASAGATGGLATAGDGTSESDGADAVLAAASREERLRTTAFAALTADELADVRRLVRDLVLAPPPRRTRRRRAGPSGRIDLRRTIRRAHRTGGDPVRLVRRRRRVRPRRLVLLCDVSGSMEPYTRVFLTLLHGVVVETRAEAFVFATRLTRLTRALGRSDPDAALTRAARTAPDWAGGTRLGEALRRFVDDHGRRGVARGAVVVVVSDGWERDDPAAVAEQMARLRRLAHRIVWVNPRSAAPGFAPLTGGMAAALPYCDAVVSGHSVEALQDVAAAVAGPGHRTRTGRHR